MSDRPAQQMPKCRRRMNIFNSLHMWTRLSSKRSCDLHHSTTCNRMVANNAETKIASHDLHAPPQTHQLLAHRRFGLQQFAALGVFCEGWAWQRPVQRWKQTHSPEHIICHYITRHMASKQENVPCKSMRHKQRCSRQGIPSRLLTTSTQYRRQAEMQAKP